MPVNFKNIRTTGNRGYREDMLQRLNDSLQYLPLKKRAAVLASIIEESGGDPLAKSDNATYQGLLQWGHDRYNVTSNDREKELSKQVRYMRDTFDNTADQKSWTHGGEGSGYQSWEDAYRQFNDESLPLDSVFRGFNYGYVRPKGKEDSYNNRLKAASQVYDRLKEYEDNKMGPDLLPEITSSSPTIKDVLKNFKSEGGFLPQPKDKWDELSLREKAAMMKVAVNNGITNLAEIRRKYNEFADGGDTKGDEEPLRDTFNDNSSPTDNKFSWLEHWYNNRDRQLADAGRRNSISILDVARTLLPNEMTEDYFTNKTRNEILNRLFSVEEGVLPRTRGDFGSLTRNQIDWVSKFLYQNVKGFDDIDDAKNNIYLTRGLYHGAYNPSEHSIVYKPNVNNSIRIHERSHALFEPIRKQLRDIGLENKILKDGNTFDYYLDKDTEIYSRLNEFRYRNRLNPNHIITEEELQELKKNAIDYDLLDRYSDDYLLKLLNDVAYNPTSIQTDNSNITALGGPIVQRANRFDEGGTKDISNSRHAWYMNFKKEHGRKPTWWDNYKRNLYNLVNPADGYPNSAFELLIEKPVQAVTAAFMPDTPKIRRGNNIEPVSEAAWAKRLGMPYDESLVVDNGDGTYRLPAKYEAEIPTDTTFLKNRIAANKKLANSPDVVGKQWQTLNKYIEQDQNTLDALRHTYKTGEPVVLNEYSHNSRTATTEPTTTPLNVLQNFTVQYNKDNNTMDYSDIYDFNWFEPFVPGKSYKIKGSVPLKKSLGGPIVERANRYDGYSI